jgi:signal transduction histidine kinase
MEGSALVIEYTDDGAGVPNENKDLIFKRGFGSNTGLGLFLTREILAITDIEIRETGIKGVRFEVRVPQGRYRIDN